MHLWLWKFKENFHFPFYRNVNSNTNKVKFCPPDPVLIFPIIHAITQGYPLVHFVIQRFESDEGDTDSVVDVIADLGRELGPISDGDQREFELLTLAETWQGDKTNLGPRRLVLSQRHHILWLVKLEKLPRTMNMDIQQMKDCLVENVVSEC